MFTVFSGSRYIIRCTTHNLSYRYIMRRRHAAVYDLSTRSMMNSFSFSQSRVSKTSLAGFWKTGTSRFPTTAVPAIFSVHEVTSRVTSNTNPKVPRPSDNPNQAYTLTLGCWNSGCSPPPGKLQLGNASTETVRVGRPTIYKIQPKNIERDNVRNQNKQKYVS